MPAKRVMEGEQPGTPPRPRVTPEDGADVALLRRTDRTPVSPAPRIILTTPRRAIKRNKQKKKLKKKSKEKLKDKVPLRRRGLLRRYDARVQVDTVA